MDTDLKDIMIRLQVQLEERDKSIKNTFENFAAQNAKIESKVEQIAGIRTDLQVFRAEYQKDLFYVKVFAGVIGFITTMVANFGIKLWKPVI